MSTVGHRAGAFKQQNKKHKTGRHRSKGTIDNDQKGKTDVKTLSKSGRRELSRVARRNQSKQLRENKKSAVLAEKRSLGGANSPPYLTAVVSLTDQVSADVILGLVSSCDDSATATASERNITYLSVPRYKSRFGFVVPDPRKLHEVLDALKIVDTLALIWPLDGELDESSELLLSAIFSHGVPATLHLVYGLSSLNSKQKEIARKNVNRLMDKWSFGDKFYTADNASDGLVIFRQISTGKKRPLILQKRRPHLLVEQIDKVDVEGDKCTLKVSGYMRGPALSVNGLVHLPGWGDFQMKQIDLTPDPHPLTEGKRKNEMDEGAKVLEVADQAKQTSLQSEVVPDPMEGEQTWPTQEDLDDATRSKLEPKKVGKKVPKGTSEYQAAWIVDEENGENKEENDEDDDDDEGSDENMSDESDDPDQPEAAMDDDDMSQGDDDEDDDGAETMTVASQFGDNDDDDAEIDMAEVERYRQARENAMFPDEIDTPLDAPARVRFQKYRGLKSFRTSEWDPKENLPVDYARIFKFADFRRTKKRVLDDVQTADGALHGWFVTVHIANVPTQFVESLDSTAPLVIFGLLPHEQRVSVLNIALRRHPSCQATVKSKDKLIFHVGYRRFEAAPVFSQHTNGDKHKMERYLPAEGVVVASVYAPIIFPPSSVLVFREDKRGRHQLVATGAVLDLNPDRVVVKRIVLSGHPFKINKRHAVVRYMFFNREDIEWFKPVELRTKYGRRGHIKEGLGTHGHMKCVFDGQLTSQDEVMLNLYKRVFPKWTYNPRVNTPSSYRRLSTAPSTHVGDEDDDEMQCT
uniref:Pre-rRNA-processing protein TSR1 homolog n=1 Tax=Plectus sambesii TaxID=2011161 RepID=A0A914WYA7_9BILA